MTPVKEVEFDHEASPKGQTYREDTNSSDLLSVNDPVCREFFKAHDDWKKDIETKPATKKTKP